MTKRAKDRERFIKNPQGFSWGETVTLLIGCGFTVKKPQDGSHWRVYHKGMPGTPIVSVPIHNDKPTSPYYFTRLARMVEDWLTLSGEGEDGEE